jgi:NitT/TauT family transport system substrate-binding protein
MRHTIVRRGAASAALAAALGLVAIAPAGAQDVAVPEIPETPTPMEFLYAGATFYAPFFVAEDKGYFDDYGVDVTLANKSGTAETIQLLATGQSQSGGSTWGAGLFNTMAQDESVSIVSQLARVPTATDGKPVSPLIVKKARFDSGELDTIEELAGKRIGAPPGAFGEYSVELALRSGGLSVDDVELVIVGPPDAAAQLDSEQIDAAFSIEPLATLFEAQGLTASVSDHHAAGTELAFIAFNDAWLQENTDAAIRFTAAYLKAARELESGGWQDPAVHEIVSKYTELPLDVLGQIGLTEASEDGSFDEASIRDQEAFFRDRGQIEYDGEADLAKVLRPEILAAANAFLEANP